MQQFGDVESNVTKTLDDESLVVETRCQPNRGEVQGLVQEVLESVEHALCSYFGLTDYLSKM